METWGPRAVPSFSGTGCRQAGRQRGRAEGGGGGWRGSVDLYVPVECQTEQMDLKRKNMKGDISQCLILAVVEVSDVCTHACADALC